MGCLQDGQLVRRLLTSLKVRVLSPAAVVLEGVLPLLETLADDAQALTVVAMGRQPSLHKPTWGTNHGYQPVTNHGHLQVY